LLSAQATSRGKATAAGGSSSGAGAEGASGLEAGGRAEGEEGGEDPLDEIALQLERERSLKVRIVYLWLSMCIA